MLNDKLNWKDHKNYVRNKISRNLGILYKCRNIMKIEDLINMYNSFILPYLLYCLSLWGGSIKSHNDIVSKMQDKLLRILFNTRRSEDAWSYVKNKIVPVQELYKIEISKLCYKHVLDELPESFVHNVMPSFASEIHNIDTRHSTSHNYQLQKSNVSPLAYNSFTTQCIKIWNSIPHKIKNQTRIHQGYLNFIKAFKGSIM